MSQFMPGDLPPPRKAWVHLFRGAPAVRSWSRYKTTVKEWTLCGIRRQDASYSRGAGRHCVEEASQVSCPYCRDLMET